MNISKVNALVERAADVLAELAHELRQAAGKPDPTMVHLWGSADEDRAGNAKGDPPACACGLGEEAGDARSLDPLGRIRSFWDGVWMAPVMALGDARIDLSTAEGRWELLVVAVLLGARVSDGVVQQTFARLREAGLTDPYRLAESPEHAKEALRKIFDAHYRALGSKEGKIDALIYNAKRIVECWQGDLNAIYLQAAIDDGGEEPVAPVDEEALIRALQSFRHVKQLAFWVCRTLKAHGIWRDLSDWATGYHDRYTRLPLERLKLLKPGNLEMPNVGVMPLYLQGLNLCAQNDIKTCLAECPAYLSCPWARDLGRIQDETHSE